MLTNFINEASHELRHSLSAAKKNRGVNEVNDPPVIQRNIKLYQPAAEQADIYDRAREIYYRARRDFRARSTNIL